MRLHALRHADVKTLSGWLPAVAVEAGYERWTDLSALSGLTATQAITNAERSAFLAFEIGAPAPDATLVEFLAVEPDRRRLGIGGRMAMGLERHLRGKTRRVCALVPSSIGLALYFWLRLGYRPLTKRAWPAHPDQATPAVWMEREL